MKKILLLLFALIFTINFVDAQRDTEHWIAPYFDSSSTSASNYTHGLFFSTDSVTPFQVTIFNNGVSIGNVTISKGSPAMFSLPQQYIRTSTATDALTIKTLGIRTLGSKPYFLTLRMGNISHGEILTSKGKAGIGTQFFAAAAPLTTSSSSMNFTTGILATEDNTTVTISGYDPMIQFINGVGLAPLAYTVNLNKGQSYILAGLANTPANQDGFIGAKIESDKPISVTNGNANGMFGMVNTNTGSDLILDQSVPTSRLGTDFGMVRSQTYLADVDNMEGGIVVATENNTQIFLNNNLTTPVATINAGQYYRILSNAYVSQGNNHYNMFVKTSKKAYLYQLLGMGTTSSGTNTGGYNYIPPLNCFLPRKIDEIGLINQLPGSSGTVTLKLNILTEAGATVTVNGATPAPNTGPYPIPGNSGWVSYGILGITGNVTVVSDKAVTAGVNGGYSTAGYGGYFAGFSSVPVIAKKTGDCIPGIVLEVDDSFDTYQWYLNGNPISGANTYSYTPTVAGNYTVKVTVGSCVPVTTPVFEVHTCVVQTTVAATVCSSKTFTPTFTNSSQTPVASTSTITAAPTNGTATVDLATGIVTYTPNAGYLGPDQFKYKFCGNDPQFPDCEEVTVNITVAPFEVNDVTLQGCPYNGVGVFDLFAAPVTTTTPVTKLFYPSLTDLNNNTNIIQNPYTYQSAAGSVYVKVTTPEGCVDIAKITLVFLPVPPSNDDELTECFIEGNVTKGEFDLTSAVVTTASGLNFMYYPSLTDAENNTNQIATPTAYISPTSTVYVRIINAAGCYAIAKISLIVTPPHYSTTLQDKIICVEDRTTLDAGPGFQAYEWSTGAVTQSISNVTVGEYWVLLTHDGCKTKQTVKVYKAPDPTITAVDVSNSTVTLTVQGGTAPYKYSIDNVLWQDSNVFENVPRGQNTFYVKDSYDCDPVSIEITVPNLVNAFTPNGDGINDFLDYSSLAYKKNLSFSVYNRYGDMVFKGSKANNFRWDGKYNDQKLATGTYWYQINWNENDARKTAVKYSGWILIKNK